MHIQIIIPVKASFFLKKTGQSGLTVNQRDKQNIVFLEQISSARQIF